MAKVTFLARWALLASFEYRDIEEEPNQPDIALVKHIVQSLSKLEEQVAGSTQYFYFNRSIKGGEESQPEPE